MEPLSKEQSVIQLLNKLKIGMKTELCQSLNISHMTVVRALKKYGYYSSFNKNSSYYTLKDIPEFNNLGLWFYDDIGFSIHKNINNTVLFIIENSQKGYTEKKLSIILHTKTGNILSRLVKQNRLCKSQTGHSVMYVSVNETQRKKQLATIRASTEKSRPENQTYDLTQEILPTGISVSVVISTLVSLIEKPDSTDASLSISLQKKGIQVTASQIRAIISFYELKKKAGTIKMSELLNVLKTKAGQEIIKLSEVCGEAEYIFDQQEMIPENNISVPKILKTTVRKVVSLQHSEFKAKSVIRKDADNKPLGGTYKTPSLVSIVPSGARYAFDLIAEIGIKSYIEARKLSDIQQDLKQDRNLDIALSSMFDQQRKFLFYFGALHHQSAGKIKSYLQDRKEAIIWLLDGTIEVGTPVFFGIKEAVSSFMLDCWKIPTENKKDISRCLGEGSLMYGEPDIILHDLSSKINDACEESLKNKPHKVCDFHFTRDVGDGLYENPQNLLSARLKKLKLKIQLQEQRKRQTAWLREAINQKQVSLVIRDLLNGASVSGMNNKSYGREIYLAINDWILDFASDGNRQGFPFDPYLLYFQRRIRKASLLTDELISRVLPVDAAPQVMINFNTLLKTYLIDTQIIEAEKLYEKAYEIFNLMRTALNMQSTGKSPMFEAYDIHQLEHNQIKHNFEQIQYQFKEEEIKCADPNEKKLYTIVNKHIIKYDKRLFTQIPHLAKGKIIRTTNDLEQTWGTSKRIIRQTKGNKRLTREFNSLPSEYMLISNLNNPIYVKEVLGGFENLPGKLAEAAKTAGTYSNWLKTEKPIPIGRLPKKILRKENFVTDLITICKDNCN